MHKTLISTALAVLLAAPLIQAAPSFADSKKLTFGVDYNVLAVPFVAASQRGAREEAAKLGVTLIERDAGGNTTKQASDIQDLLTAGVDGMIIAGNGEANTLGALRPAIAANIPIVAFISKIGTQTEAVPQPPPNSPAGGILAFAAQNEEYAGKLAAEMVIDALPGGGKIAVSLGSPGYSENTTRLVEFDKTLAAAKAKYEKVAAQPGNWTPEGGQSACQNMLAAHPDIKLFYALNDDMAIGCSKAIAQAGSIAKVISVGGSKGGLQAVKKGILYGTIWYSPETIGRDAVRTLFDYITERAVPADRYVTYDIHKVTAANIDQFINKGEW